jgi:GNAT superfamily N-acetyltransferase
MEYKFIEELTLNNWQPIQTLLYDGWVLRFADGYTKRANSVNPILSSTLDVHQKIEECEKRYASRRLPVVFKITPFVQPKDLDRILEMKGYERIAPSSVQLLSLTAFEKPYPADVHLEEKVSAEWVDAFCSMSGAAKHRETMAHMLGHIATPACFLTLYHNGVAAACGLGVVEREYLGLYDIVTDAAYRNRGFGEQVVRHLLHWGRTRGAKFAYLAVTLDNAPALHLYAKIGFKEIYRYWYRVKHSKR